MLLSLPVLVPRRNPKRWLVVFMLMRLIFFPLFFWRALPSMGNNSDTFAFVLVALFSASNGFVGTLAMQEGPQHCKFAPLPLLPLRPLTPSSRQKCFPTPLSHLTPTCCREKDREIAGTVLAFCLMVRSVFGRFIRGNVLKLVAAAGGAQLGRTSWGRAEYHLVFQAGHVLNPGSIFASRRYTSLLSTNGIFFYFSARAVARRVKREE
jgi:hypothetical protein